MARIEVTPELKNSFLSKIHFSDCCWAWKGGITQSGYGALTLKIGGKKKTYSAHRISYVIHKGEIPEGDLVCHSCDNKWCVNPDHLWVGSKRENALDAIWKGKWTHGGNIHTKKQLFH